MINTTFISYLILILNFHLTIFTKPKQNIAFKISVNKFDFLFETSKSRNGKNYAVQWFI